MPSERESAGPKDLWVFGYGSLMWQPGFPHVEAVHARLAGYHRAFCVYSIHYRGSTVRPGLVLGLDRGGSCEGVAFRVAGAHVETTLRYLRQREQITGVYREKIVPIALLSGEHATALALTYLVERAHPSYAGPLALRRQADLIRGARGRTGTNIEYFVNTRLHLAELGIRDTALARLAATLGGFVSAGSQSEGGCARARSIAGVAQRVPVKVRKMRPDQRKRFRYRLMLGTRQHDQHGS